MKFLPTIRFFGLVGLATMLFQCGPKPKMNVWIRMMPAQDKYFREKIIAPFEKQNHCEITVSVFKNTETLADSLASIPESTGVDLLKTPFEMTKILAQKDLILPINKITTQKKLEQLHKEYFLLNLVKENGNLYYLPRKFETRTIVYRKSQVADAVANWTGLRRNITSSLAKYNEQGLPKGYRLEEDPSQWDLFDLYVVGYYWSNTEIDNQKKPRIAHRAKRYPGTALGLIDRAYELGAEKKHILKMDGDPILDMFFWNSVMVREKILNPRMYQEGWSGSDIWKGFQSGDVFLSDMTQIDAFFIHGAGSKDMPGFLKDPDDLGVALMPLGVSLELDSQGKPKRVGARNVTTGGWWWGIPKSAKHPELSLKLIEFITNTENQIEGCSSYGMVPVRKDILGELSLMFGGGWITQVFHVASLQLVENKYTVVPQIEEYWSMGENYIDAYYDICINGLPGRITKENIQRRLQERYIPRQKKLLGKKYPGD